LKTINNFGCVLAVNCHCRYFVRLPTTKLQFDCFLLTALCTAYYYYSKEQKFSRFLYDRSIRFQALGNSVTVLRLIAYSGCCIARFISCNSMRISCLGLHIIRRFPYNQLLDSRTILVQLLRVRVSEVCPLYTMRQKIVCFACQPKPKAQTPLHGHRLRTPPTHTAIKQAHNKL